MVLSRESSRVSLQMLSIGVILGVVVLLFIIDPSVEAVAGENVTQEHLIKTAFVYNFLKFVKWNSNSSSITICVIGDGPMAVALESLEGKRIEMIPLSLRMCDARRRVSGCRVVFVSRQWRGNLKKLLRKCESAGVLTISDIDGFVDEGGIIGLKKERGRIRFEVNLRVAKEAHVFISSKLLKLASRVVK